MPVHAAEPGIDKFTIISYFQWIKVAAGCDATFRRSHARVCAVSLEEGFGDEETELEILLRDAEQDS